MPFLFFYVFSAFGNFTTAIQPAQKFPLDKKFAQILVRFVGTGVSFALRIYALTKSSSFRGCKAPVGIRNP